MVKSKTKVFNLSRIIPEMAKVFTEDELDYLLRLHKNPLQSSVSKSSEVAISAKMRMSHICSKALELQRKEGQEE